MSVGLIILCYCIFAYGFSNMMVFGSGPFHIFEFIREISSRINEHFGTMFSCMMCFPANLGWVLSLIDILLPAITFTPFNFIITDPTLWYLTLLGDCCFTSGIVWLIHNIESLFENWAESFTTTQTEYVEDVKNSIEAEDITLNKK